MNGIEIKKGDFIAINKGNIILSSNDLSYVALNSISKVSDDISAVSLFTGKDLEIDPYDILDDISDEYGIDGIVLDSKDEKYILMIGVC